MAQHSESGPRSARAAPYIHLLGVVGLGHLDQSAVPLVLQDLDAHHVTVRTKHVEYGRYIRYLNYKVYKFLLTTGNRKIFFSAFKYINKILKKYRNEPKQKSSNQSRCVIPFYGLKNFTKYVIFFITTYTVPVQGKSLIRQNNSNPDGPGSVTPKSQTKNFIENLRGL